ncbi:hypothetical protein A11A3_12690 [Alcanivorax hongdengensis A-11-3]|uniref:DUF1461 domain-containing protein n=1 Tax=Alcanivorax hongdengensis A-11-3 TaxID=1177179 RepID=L0W9C2_9GAMM|nr:DUF1461 domain-containing protein [Alcanivorax hongdengensis]EKF73584.1 hypothetical protein A11A3_12690 [Alcanivorax hongdengensis A-11-3]
MGKMAAKSQFSSTLLWFFYGLCSLLLAICVTWGLYSQINYGFPFWYKQLHINEHIHQYAPKNRHKHGFAQLPPEQHMQAFEQITRAVHHGGEGLEAITYQAPGWPPQRLLDRAEVQHLQDVAHFIDLGRWLMLGLAILWLPLAWLCIRRGLPFMRYRLLFTVFVAGAVIAWFAVAGPTAVFYQFHIWLFPAGHQWFFYWQDSLMSTLMKAPDLFGGIAAVIGAGALALTPLLYFSGLRLTRHIQTRNGS